jgi:putative hemolysin
VGLFHLKDLLIQQDRDQPLTTELRPLLFVPESKDVAALLSEMRSGQTHLAAVVDEHGDFTGIVTMADCLQALTGPAADIRRKPDQEIYRIGARSWIIGGRVDLRELRETCDVSLPPSRDYVTVAGYVMAQMGRIPRLGERLTVEAARFTILEMADHKIVRLQMDRRQDSGQREQA